jgi:hypothetical protein
MKQSRVFAAVIVAFFFGLSLARAATNNASNESTAKPISATPLKDKLSLTKEQKDAVWQDIAKQARKERAPPQFVAKVGAVVPDALMTYPVPMTTSSKVSTLLRYQYALLDNNSLLIVNPYDQKIADVITRQ